MRFWKKLLVAGALVLVVALVIPACAPPAQEVPSAEEVGIIKIGVLAPMQFIQGEDAWNAAVMAAEEINEAGGVDVAGVKYEIELVKKESNEFTSIPDAVSAFESLCTVENVDFIVGGFRSEAVLGMQEVMAAYKKPFLNTGAASPQLTLRVHDEYDKYKYFFRSNCMSSILTATSQLACQASTIAAVREKLGIETPKVALLMEKALYVDPMLDIMNEYIPKFGGEVVGLWRPSPTAETLTGELSAIKDSGAQIITTALGGPVGTTFNREWGELKIPAVASGFNVEACSKKHWEATNGNCEYARVWIVYARAPISDTSVEFWDGYTERFGDYPSMYSATHSSIYQLKEAIERAGTLDADAVVAEMEKTDTRTSYGGIAYYPKENEAAHDAIFGPEYGTCYHCQWQAGNLEVIWPDGKPLPGLWPDPDAWKAVNYSTAEYVLPPWVVEYWQGK